jgi:hypothetical protein
MCVEMKRIIKSRDVVFLEGTREVESVYENNHSKQVEHVVVEEVMNDDELVKDDNYISLKERPTNGVEGEFTSNSSSYK